MEPTPKPWWQSSTIKFAIIKIVGGALLAWQQNTPEPLILSLTAVIDLYLRATTTQPITLARPGNED